MKIIIFTSFYGSGYGLGYSAYKEANEFCKAGHDITVVYINKEEDIQLNEKILFFHLPKVNFPFFDIIDYFFKLRKFFNKKKLNGYDIIYIQSLEFGLLSLAKIKTPIFYFCRSSIRGISCFFKKYDIKNSITKKIINIFLVILEKRLLNCSRTIFVKSKLMADELMRFYQTQPKNIKVIYGGIDDKDFNKISREEEINEIRKRYRVKYNYSIKKLIE